MGERLISNLIPAAAETLPVGCYVYSSAGLDGRGVYRITRVFVDDKGKGQVYGVLVDKEPLDKPWWRYNADEGISSALPFHERRDVPANKKKRKSKKKAEAF